ncbi:GntR family transcriptional regulator [Phenylobacterium hankyongense]|uniref:GntR family transcriptional regulator n=1 Tax=Phenylobacterium hankyongense TaxID=1813876 RepID=A0A328B0A8_9CAUL|nr:UTRA domain-containing protein [Phenylobacterium hankyongense]RAK58458.1 GntR family transcriptional regulator [Phenylobacterium hankyongense]
MDIPSLSDDVTLEQLQLDGSGPVWLQIRRALAQPILNGKWRPGARIPAELDLKEHFQTSRMTVNKAIQSLAAEGLLQRRRKIGTVVSERAQERPVFEIWNTADVVARAGAEYGYRLLEREVVKDDQDKAALLDVSRSTRLLWLRCVHMSDGRPFQLEERLVNVDAAPGITCHPLETVPPGPWLLAHVPWTQAEHTIMAREAGEAEADALAVPLGSACLVVERRTWNGDVPVTLARLWHPGAQHRLVGRFEPAR